MFGDPFTMSSKMIEQMEALFIERMKEMLGSPSFLSSLSKGVESGLEGKKEFDSALKKHMESLNIPTRDDIAKILIYLQRIESKVADLEESVEDLSDELKAIKNASPVKAPPVRTQAREAAGEGPEEVKRGRTGRAAPKPGRSQGGTYRGRDRSEAPARYGEKGPSSGRRGERSSPPPRRAEKGAPRKSGGRKKR